MLSWGFYEVIRAEQKVRLRQAEVARRSTRFNRTHRSPSVLRSLLAHLNR